ncbi:BTAD domain-containing putative transcriptional regulator [Kutzneria buriramensis]|uniref:Putative ATPase n=1 Tax=Kutzneria buriramensis TaxID=1045776 RepID=A0A3E0HI88_9PSEU|nr:BTAD domain-containing putative transcriptional regulator [Kutzneria buriramensis]REH46102.1 putative ATPase [Kutzneria buriramensis]
MELRLLGPVEARSGETVLPLGPRQQRLLLAVLACEVNRTVTIDRLIELLWPDDPPRTATHAVRVMVSKVRSLLAGADMELCTQGSRGYLLRANPMNVDVHRFRALIEESRAIRDDHRLVQVLDQALALWRGPVLADTVPAEARDQLFSGLTESRLLAVEDRFDALLRLGRHRDALGDLTAEARTHPTRERLTGQLMLALVRNGQIGAALDAARRTRDHLADELGVDPGRELHDLELAILRNDPALAAPSVRGSRPPVPRTRLIGRDEEVSAIQADLPTVRLLTVTGPGGVGKTRLALAVAAGFESAFIPLAGLSEPRLVLATIAASLGDQDVGGLTLWDTLAAHLGDRRLLLVLDNMEHLLDAAPDLGRLLDRVPGLTILATSRSPLRIHGECVHVVRPLRPDAATELFAERSRHSGAPAPEVSVAAAICERLDRLPLAIELAAARARQLSAPTLLTLLDESPHVLDGPLDLPERHRTLRDTIAWSYRLLNPAERELLHVVAVFAGGWTLAAATAVAGLDAVTAVDLHVRLVDASLIVRDNDRYTMLDTIRAFALDNAAPGCARARHAAYFEDVVAKARIGAQSRDQRMWLDRLREDHDNLRAAMRWLLDHGQTDRFAGVFVFWHWLIEGRFFECRQWAAEALAAREMSASSRVGVLAMHGMAVAGTDPAQALRLVGDSVRLAAGDGVDPAARATALMAQGNVAVWLAQHQLAVRAFDEAESVLRQLGWVSSWAGVRAGKAYVVLITGNAARAERQLAGMVTRLRREGGEWDLALALNYQGHALLRLGDAAAAQRVVREAVAIWDRLDAPFTMMYALTFLAIAAAAQGDPRRSALLTGAASVLVDRFGPAMIGDAARDAEHAASRVIGELGRATFDDLIAQGRSLSRAEVVALAVD